MKIRVSLLVYLLAASSLVCGFFIDFLSYLVAIVLHEAAHARVAAGRGYVLSEFRLMPYGAALIGEFEGADWKDETAIAVAGPMLNLALSVLGVAAWWLVPACYYFTERFVAASLALALVNLLPVYPLDGGRIALALISRNIPRPTAYKRLRVFGFVAGALFAAAFVLSLFYGANLSLATMAAFILLSTAFDGGSCWYTRLYHLAARDKKLLKGLAEKTFVISASASASTLFHLLGANHYSHFKVKSASATLAEFDESLLETLPSSAFSGFVSDLVVFAQKENPSAHQPPHP